jgi:hypothetical protein
MFKLCPIFRLYVNGMGDVPTGSLSQAYWATGGETGNRRVVPWSVINKFVEDAAKGQGQRDLQRGGQHQWRRQGQRDLQQGRKYLNRGEGEQRENL